MLESSENTNPPVANEANEDQVLLAAAPAASAPDTQAAAKTQILNRPQPGQHIAVDLIPGQPIEITFDYPAAQIVRGPGTIVFNFPDGGQLIVHGWDAAVAANPSLEVKLPDQAEATIAELRALFDAIAVAPGAGPGESGAGPANTGAAFTPYDPGNIGAGLNDLGPLGFGELAYRVPELAPKVTDQLLNLSNSGPGGGPVGGPPLISVSDVTVNEGQVASFLVSLSGPSATPVTVTFTTQNGTAGAPADYGAVTQTITFAPGETSQTVNVNTVADGVFEGNESFTVTLTNIDGAVPSDPEGTGTILDGPAPSIVINDVTVTEGGQAIFTVSLSGPSATPITVNFSTADGSATAPADYAAANGQVTFAPGQTTQTVVIGTVADAVPEANETFVVNLTNPSGATIADPQGVGTIIDSGAQPPSISIDDVTVNEGGQAVFTVSLSSPSGAPVTVNFASSDGTAGAPGDYGSVTGTVTFAPGQTTQTVTVNTVADNIVEGDENFFIDLFDANGATIADPQGVGTIVEPVVTLPTLSIDDVTVLEGNTAIFTVTLSAASATPVTVDFSSHDGTAGAPGDYGAVGGTVTFAPGQTTQTVVVNTVSDNVFEGNENYTIDLTNAVGATIADGQGLGTIIDNEAPIVITIDDVTVFEGDTAVFTVSLSGPSATPVTVNYGSTDGSANAPGDYGAVGGTVTFAPGETTQNIVVNTNQDDISENDENYFINLSSAVGATIADPQGVGTIIDDEQGLQIIINDVTVMEGQTAVFTVSLSGPTNAPVTVQYATANGTALDGADFNGTTGTITFLPGGPLTQTVSVPTVQDQVPEGTENFFVNLSNAVNAVIADGQGIGTILDNDALPGIIIDDVTVNEGETATFTITLSSATGVPVTVQYGTADGTAGAPGDYAAGSGTVTFLPGGPLTQTVTVSTVNDQLPESTENFVVNLTNATNAVIVDGQGVGTILDNDALPGIVIDDVTVQEGGVATFTVSLTSPSAVQVSASFATASGTALQGIDYTGTGGIVTFAPGQTTQTIQVTTLPDQIAEGSETFFVNLTNISGAVPVDPTGVGTILDDDSVVFSISGDSQVVEGAIANYTVAYSGTLGDGQTASVVVTTGIAAGGDVDATPLLDYVALAAASAPGVSFNPATGLLTFTGGAGNATSLAFTVPTVPDSQVEPTEDFQVQLSSPSANASIANPSVVTDILDNDQVTFNITGSPAVIEGNTASYTVSYAGSVAPGVTVSVQVATGTAAGGNPDATPVLDFGDLTALPGVSFNPATGILTFTGGGATSAGFTVGTVDDGAVEPTEDYQVQLSNPSANATIGVGAAVTNIIDPSQVLFNISGPPEVVEGTTASYTIGYDGVLGDGVTASIKVSTADFAGGQPNATPGVDYGDLTEGIGGAGFSALLAFAAAAAGPGVTFDPDTGVLTFTGGAGNATSIVLDVATLPDKIVENVEDFQVQLSDPSANAVIGVGAVVTDIIDDDTVAFSITGDTSVNEGVTANYTVSYVGTLADGVTASVQVNTADFAGGNPNAAPIDDYLTLAAGSATGVSYNPATHTLTFTGGAGNATSLGFSVPTVDDTTTEPTEDFQVQLSGPSANATITTAAVVTNILDNDQVTFNITGQTTVTEGNVAIYTVSYTGALADGVSASVHVATADFNLGNPNATPGLDYSGLLGGTGTGVTFDSGTGLLTFTGGAGNATSVVFGIQTSPDTFVENTEDYQVQLSGPSANATIGTSSVVTDIIDNDAVVFNITGDFGVLEGDTASYTVSYTGILAPGITASIKVATGIAGGGATDATPVLDFGDLTAAPGVDFNPATGVLTFTGGGATSVGFTVPTVPDAVTENTEDYRVALSTPSANASIGVGAVTTLILDSDHVTFNITGDTVVTEGATASYTVGYTGTLGDGVTASVQVNTADYAGSHVNATSGVDYLALAAGSAPGVSYNPGTHTLTFTGGAGNATSLNFTVPTFDDSTTEPTEDYQVQLSNPSSNASIGIDSAPTDILDNDQQLLPPFGTASNPPGQLAATFVDVSLQYNPLGSTTVGDYLLNNNIDGQAINPALVNGVDSENLTLSAGADVSVQFVREIAGFHNMVGWYTFDASGNINPGSIKFLWTDASADSAANYANLIASDFLGNDQPETISLGSLAAGTHIGFFLISDGANFTANQDLLLGAVGGPGTGNYDADIAAINAVTGLTVDGSGNGFITVNGQALTGATYFTHDSTLNNDFGQGADILHSVSGITNPNDGFLYVGWEDYPGGGDRDYNDVVFRVDIGDYNLSSATGVVWDPVISLGDPDSPNLTQMVISTTGFHTGDTLTIPGFGSLVIGPDTDGGANYHVAVSGTAPIGDYQALADGIFFTLSTASPVEGVRTIALALTDDTGLNNVNPIVSTFDIVINQTISTSPNGSYDLGGGNDRALLSDHSFLSIDGGSGIDTVQPAQNGMGLDSSDFAKIDNIEAIDLGGFGNNTVALTPQDVLDVTDSNNALRVLGDAGDSVDINPAVWSAPTTVNEGGVLFNQYTAAVGPETAILKIEQDVTVT